MSNIYIVGFMGTGKTAAGKQIARQLNHWFVDLDLLIEKRQHKQIRDIFAEDGEAHFRSLEKQTLEEIARKSDSVVSCGGGIVLDKANIQLMKQTGTVVCLTSRPEVILERTKGYEHRPLLNVDNPKQAIEELLKARAAFYAQADFTIDTSDLTIDAVVGRLLKYVSAKPA